MAQPGHIFTENRTELNRTVGFSVFRFGFGFLLGELRSSASASVLSSNQTDPPKNRCLVRKVKKSAVRHGMQRRSRPTNTPSPRRPHACTHHSRVPGPSRTLTLSFALRSSTRRRRGRPAAADRRGHAGVREDASWRRQGGCVRRGGVSADPSRERLQRMNAFVDLCECLLASSWCECLLPDKVKCSCADLLICFSLSSTLIR